MVEDQDILSWVCDWVVFQVADCCGRAKEVTFLMIIFLFSSKALRLLNYVSGSMQLGEGEGDQGGLVVELGGYV